MFEVFKKGVEYLLGLGCLFYLVERMVYNDSVGNIVYVDCFLYIFFGRNDLGKYCIE